jgi:Sigma-70, region 4/Homeodomain-like domain
MTLRTPQKRRGRCNYTGPAFSAIGNASAETRYGGAVDINRAADLYAQGWTVRQIGAELGVTGTTVSDQLRRAGVTLRRGGAPAHRASTQQILELRDQGLTWPEIAEQVGMTVSGAWSRYRRARPPSPHGGPLAAGSRRRS